MKHNFSLRSAFTFLMVGGFATLLHYLLTALLSLGFKMPLVTSSAIGFAISAVANYFLNARFTFQSQASHRQTLPRFAATALAGLLVNTLMLAWLVSVGLHAIVSQTLSTLCVILWNYGINSIWTFRKKALPEPAP